MIGEHTDYNNGFVLPSAIDKTIVFKFKKHNHTENCTVSSSNLNTQISFDLSLVEPSATQWKNYVLGVNHEILLITDKLGGFDCWLSSDILFGSGIYTSL